MELAFYAAQSDRMLAADAAAFDDAPARGGRRGIDVLGSGFGFVHEVVWDFIEGVDSADNEVNNVNAIILSVSFPCMPGSQRSPRTLLLRICGGAWVGRIAGMAGMARCCVVPRGLRGGGW